MQLKIVCFEDDPKHRELLKTIFSDHNTEFRFYLESERDWNVTPQLIKEIAEFAPDFAVVDLRNDKKNDSAAGYRIIRQLRDQPETSALPIIAWSALLGETQDGIRAAERLEPLRAKPLYKSTHVIPTAQRFLDAIGSDQLRQNRTANPTA